MSQSNTVSGQECQVMNWAIGNEVEEEGRGILMRSLGYREDTGRVKNIFKIK